MSSMSLHITQMTGGSSRLLDKVAFEGSNFAQFEVGTELNLANLLT